MRHERVRRTILLACVAGALTACAPTPPPVAKDREQLGDLKEHGTTKADVMLKFGAPAASFEGERILVYRMARGEKGVLRVVSPLVRSEDPRFAYLAYAEYSLVLVFDRGNALEEWNLVPVGR